MAEYIERAAIMEFPIRKDHCDKERANEHFIFGIESVLEYVENLPAADVAPVVHGRWIHLGGDEWCCSACGFVITTDGSWDKPTKKYCEDCGARMDGDDDAKAD
mgnify:CR=1 FL=1|jgi:hypothetical protein